MALRTRGVIYRSARQILVFAAIAILSLSGSLAGVTAGALSGTGYKLQSFTEGWTTYNHEPSGGSGVESFGGREGTFRVGVDSTGPDDHSEGLQRALPSSDTVRASLYLESEWQTQSKDIRIGMGVVGNDSSGNSAANVTVEFIRTAIFSGWRIGNETIGWANVGSTYTLDAWNDLEFAINKTTHDVEIYINGNLVTQNSPRQAATLRTVMLTNYNFGTVNNGYASHWSALEAGWYDQTSPTIAFLTPSVESEVLNGSRYTSVLASDEIALRQVSMIIKNNDGEVVRENAPYITGTDCRLDVSLAGLPDGAYSIETSAKDNASNESETITRALIIDSSAPQLSINSPNSGPTKGVIAMNGTMVDAHPHHYYFVVKNSNGEVVAGPQTVNDTTVASWQWDTTTQPDGVYVVVLAAEDAAGNQVETTREITIDNTAPMVTLDAFGSNPVSGKELTFSGDVGDSNASILLRVDGIDYPVTNKQDGRWSHTFINGLSTGSHSVAVIASDGLGNVSSIDSSPFSVKDIEVASPVFIAGMGSVALETKPLIDTARLFQMATATTPQNITKPSFDVSAETDVVRHSDATPIATTESPSVALEPTENGWKILGVLWYWWAFCIALVAVGGWFVVTRWWRPKSEALTD